MRIAALLFPLVLAACGGAPLGETIARATAKSVVLPIVAARVPGPEAQVITACILDNAQSSELFALARDIAVEPGTSTLPTVATIAARPETLACIARSGVLPLTL